MRTLARLPIALLSALCYLPSPSLAVRLGGEGERLPLNASQHSAVLSPNQAQDSRRVKIDPNLLTAPLFPHGAQDPGRTLQTAPSFAYPGPAQLHPRAYSEISIDHLPGQGVEADFWASNHPAHLEGLPASYQALLRRSEASFKGEHDPVGVAPVMRQLFETYQNLCSHSYGVGGLSALIAAEIVPQHEVAAIRTGAILHDIGKGHQDILPLEQLRRPLNNEDEWPRMRLHPTVGLELLTQSGIAKTLPVAAAIVYDHHETQDGTGYPNGLRGADIPLPAAIVNVADYFDAVVRARPYKERKSVEETLAIMATHAKQWNQRAWEALQSLFMRPSMQQLTIQPQ